MRARTWVPVVVASLLVLGVVVTREDTSVDERDLRSAAAGPSAPASVATGDDALASPDGLLTADGLPGLRLGSPADPLTSLVDVDLGTGQGLGVDDLPAGCDLARDLGRGGIDPGWLARAWVVDGEVSSVVVSAPVDPEGGTDGTTRGWTSGLLTWLGPTLGSPLEVVGGLPGASTVTHRPLGDGGPVVTVVQVPHDGVESVWSDVGSPGAVATVEVRRPGARACSMQALAERFDELGGTGAGEPVLLTLAGLPELPLGLRVDDLVGMPRVQRQQGDGTGRCATYWVVDDEGRATTVKVEDQVVVGVEPAGPVTTDLGVATGDPLDVLVAVFPELGDGSSPLEAGGTTVVERAGKVLTLRLWPGLAWVPEVEQPVDGGPLELGGMGVREADASPAVTC